MARKKTEASVDAEITKVMAKMSALQDKYDALAEKPKELQEQKRKIEADAIMEAYANSGKSLDEVLTFLHL